MKNWQEEKAGSRRYQKTGMDLQEEKGLKHMWKEMVNTSPLLPVGHSHYTACFSHAPHQASSAAHQSVVRWETPCVRADIGFNILRLRRR